MNRLARALVLAIACTVPASAVAQAATEGSVTGRVLLSPIALELAIQPSTARAGTWVGASVLVRNIGPISLGRVSVRVRAPADIVVRPPSTRSARRLAAGGSVSFGWSLCGRVPGAYLVFVEALSGGVVVDSAARLLTVTPGPGSCSKPGRR